MGLLAGRLTTLFQLARLILRRSVKPTQQTARNFCCGATRADCYRTRKTLCSNRVSGGVLNALLTVLRSSCGIVIVSHPKNLMNVRSKTIGFISPPNWIDPSPAEFPTICADTLVTQQYPMTLFDFDDSVASEEELIRGCRVLSNIGCHAIGIVGTPFGWAGFSSPEQAMDHRQRLEAAADAPIVTASTSIVKALHSLRARRVGLACTYYSDLWRDRWAKFMSESGFDVAVARTMSDQGLRPPRQRTEDHWYPTADLIADSVERLVREHSNTDAIVVTGAGARTLACCNALQAIADGPVIGSDTALYWALATVAGVELVPGRLAPFR